MKPIPRDKLKVHKRKCTECSEFSIEVNQSVVFERLLCPDCLILLLRQSFFRD